MADQRPRLRIPTLDEIEATEEKQTSRRTNFFQTGVRIPDDESQPPIETNTTTSSNVNANITNSSSTGSTSTFTTTSSNVRVHTSTLSTSVAPTSSHVPSIPVNDLQRTSTSTTLTTQISASLLPTSNISPEYSSETRPQVDATTVNNTNPSLAIAIRGNPRAIIVSHRQKGNPILKFISCVPWEYGDVVADYHINQNTCVLYLSMKYYLFRKDYIYQRIRELGRTYRVRILLLQIDVDQFHSALLDIQKLCALNNITLVLCWSPQEAARYLETYKAYEDKPADLLKEKIDNTYLARATDLLTGVKAVNKTDVVTLLSTFGSIADIMEASPGEISLCPGFGEQKAHRLYDAFRAPFVPSKAATKSATANLPSNSTDTVTGNRRPSTSSS